MIVEFVGLPGVGKSTLSKAVATELESQGSNVFEPTRKIENQSRLHRVISKAQLAANSFLSHPYKGFQMTQVVIATDQESVSDLIRVLFNLQYITGVMINYQTSSGICLLDQGPYQGIWSVGFCSSDDWSTVTDKLNGKIPQGKSDLIVFVEADAATITDRLYQRSNGDTRFEPGTEAFDRALRGYEYLKSWVQATEEGPDSLVIKNETRESVQPNVDQITNIITKLRD